MFNSAESKKTSMVLLLLAILCIAAAIGLLLLALYIGVSSYNARLLARYAPLQAEVAEHIKAIRDFQKEHNRYPESMEEVGIELPPEWIYWWFKADGVFHKDDQAFLLLHGDKGLLFSFEEGDDGVWKYVVKGGRGGRFNYGGGSGLGTYRPLPNPK